MKQSSLLHSFQAYIGVYETLLKLSPLVCSGPHWTRASLRH